MKNFQVAIIGGGVIGSAIAWELSKYNVNVLVFEKASDVASGASKANSGVIHSGINSTPFSQKAHFCVEGNQIFKELANQLGVNLVRITNFTESGVLPRFEIPMTAEAIGLGGGAETPQIEVGENKIEVAVTITYEIN